MDWQASDEEWFTLGLEVRQALLEEVSLTRLEVTPEYLRDPKVTAVMILSRSLSHYRGLLLLAKERLEVEAQILTRACMENLLWMRRLKRDKERFVAEIALDFEHREIRNAKLMLELGANFDKQTFAYLNQAASKKRPKRIEPSKHGESEIEKREYYMFHLLSDAAAHPSGVSLDRHLKLNFETDLHEVIIQPPVLILDLKRLIINATQTLVTTGALYASICNKNEASERIFRANALMGQFARKIGMHTDEEILRGGA